MDNKNNLIEIALNLFDDKGYQGVGIQEICDKAGVTKPTLYHYFGSKLGLLSAIFESKLKDDINFFKNESSYNGDFRNSIQKLTFALASCYSKNIRTYHLLFSYILNSRENEDSTIALKYLNQIHKIVLNLFIASKEQNGNMNGREQQFAYSYLAIIIDYLNRHGIDDNKDEALYLLLHQFQFGINS
jgi:TetR/AcrR family transcriptional regulator